MNTWGGSGSMGRAVRQSNGTTLAFTLCHMVTYSIVDNKNRVLYILKGIYFAGTSLAVLKTLQTQNAWKEPLTVCIK